MADARQTEKTALADHKEDGDNAPPPYQVGLDKRTVHKECPNCGWPAKSTTKKQMHFPDFKSLFRKERKAEKTGLAYDHDAVIIPSDVGSTAGIIQPTAPVISGCTSEYVQPGKNQPLDTSTDSASFLQEPRGKPQRRRSRETQTSRVVLGQQAALNPKPTRKRKPVEYRSYNWNWKSAGVSTRKDNKRVNELPLPLSDRFRYCIRTFYCPVAHQSVGGLESAPWLAEVTLHVNDLSRQFRKDFPWRLNIIKYCWRDKLTKTRHPVVAGLYTYGRKLEVECTGTNMPDDQSMKPWVVEMTLWSRDIVWLSRLNTESLENIANNETAIRYACPLGCQIHLLSWKHIWAVLTD